MLKAYRPFGAKLLTLAALALTVSLATMTSVNANSSATNGLVNVKGTNGVVSMNTEAVNVVANTMGQKLAWNTFRNNGVNPANHNLGGNYYIATETPRGGAATTPATTKPADTRKLTSLPVINSNNLNTIYN